MFLKLLRWGFTQNGPNETVKPVEISPHIQLPQFKYKKFKLHETMFQLSTGICNSLNNFFARVGINTYLSMPPDFRFYNYFCSYKTTGSLFSNYRF